MLLKWFKILRELNLFLALIPLINLAGLTNLLRSIFQLIAAVSKNQSLPIANYRCSDSVIFLIGTLPSKC